MCFFRCVFLIVLTETKIHQSLYLMLELTMRWCSVDLTRKCSLNVAGNMFGAKKIWDLTGDLLDISDSSMYPLCLLFLIQRLIRYLMTGRNKRVNIFVFPSPSWTFSVYRVWTIINTWRAYKKYSYINYFIRLSILFMLYVYIIVSVLNPSYL